MRISTQRTWLNRDHTIARYDAVDADDFLTHLSPDEIIYPPQGSSWIYRGHADADWLLLPSLWRDLGPFDLIWTNSFAATEYHAALIIERALVDDFVRRANDLGFELPGDLGYTGPLSRELWQRYEDSVPVKVDNRQRALAQHYGVPTSLLDWTDDQFVAAFFAIQPVPDADDDDLVCVWAMNELLLGKRQTGQTHGGTNEWSRLEVVRLMKGYNTNVTAQSGVFTLLDMGTGSWRLEGDEPVEDVGDKVLDLCTWVTSLDLPAPQPSLIQVTVPRSESLAIGLELQARRISKARLFPHLESVAWETVDRHRERTEPRGFR